MIRKHPSAPTLLTLLALITLAVSPAQAQDAEEKKLGWFDTAELSFVATDGNAEASTFGFKNMLRRVWENATFTLDASALRAESTTITRRAVGTSADDFRVQEITNTELTAESYSLRSRYARNFSKRLFWYGSAGWSRNELAGIANRYTAGSGIGHIFADIDSYRFKLDYGLTYTSEEEVDTSGTEEFLGAQLSVDYFRQITPTTAYTHTLVIDENLDDTDDLRADMINALAVSISERLALKLSLQLLYDHQPARQAVPLVLPDGTDSGETVLVELDELDSILTAALVVNF